MSEQMNYMQRVGHSRCVRCDFETSDDMTFEQQDAAMMAHLADRHPNWMAEQVTAKPFPEPEAAQELVKVRAKVAAHYGISESDLAYLQGRKPEAAPASEAIAGTSALYVTKAAYDVRLAELAQLRARVAILDAQEVELPPMDYGLAAQEQCDERERQLLDALRAVQAWREVAGQQNEALKLLAQDAGGEISTTTYEVANSAAAAYDTLAGKGE